MGNQIRGSQRAGTAHTNWVPYVKLSNGATAVAMSLFAMAATALATSDSQRQLASAITTRDQSVLGRGTVGFALGELPWSTSSFEDDRDFLVAACERAASGADVHRLSYEPPSDVFSSVFARVAIMLRSLETQDLADMPPRMGALIPDKPEAVCEQHQVFLHRDGCIVCNDG